MAENTRATSRILLPFILVGIVGAAVLAAWYFKFIPSGTSPAATHAPSAVSAPAKDLGSALYNRISNPVSGTLPSTLAPISNPANSFYVNPFRR